MTRNASFAKLAPCILIEIFVQTTPQDVLSLRKCCKTLRSVSCERYVWIHLLRHACLIYHIFAPTFPLDKMTILQLEFAVTSPFRFTIALKRAATALHPHNNRVPYMTTRIVHHRDPRNSDLVLENSTIYLVPGGRFLLASSTTGVLSLMDLGYDPHALTEPISVASVVFEHVITNFEVQATADGLGIRVCIVIPLAGSVECTLVKVLEIFPSYSPASFLQVGEFWFPHHPSSYSFSKDVFAYVSGSHVGVHNFISDMAVTWSISSDESDYKIFLLENSVLLLGTYYLHEELSVWLIPPLQTAQAVPKVLQYERELFLLRSPNQYCLVSSQPAWFRSYPDHPNHIDLLGIANNGQHGVSRYMLKNINPNGDLDLPPFIPRLSLQFLLHEDYPDFNWVREFDSIRLWDKSVLLLWVEGHTLVANLSELPPSSPTLEGDSRSLDLPTSEDDWPWAAGQSVSAIFCDVEQPRTGAIAHCPMSGRLCVLSSNAICVMDYVGVPA